MKKYSIKFISVILIFILIVALLIPAMSYCVQADNHLTGNNLLELNGNTIKIFTTIEQINKMFGEPKLITDSYFGGKQYSYTDSDYTYYLSISTDEDGMITEYGAISNNFKAKKYSAGEIYDYRSSSMSGTVLYDTDRKIYGVMEYVEMSQTQILNYLDEYKSDVTKYLYNLQKHFEIAVKVNGKIRGKEFKQEIIPEDIFLMSQKLHENGSSLNKYKYAVGKAKYISEPIIGQSRQFLSELINPIYPITEFSSRVHTKPSTFKYCFIDIQPNADLDRKYKSFEVFIYDIDPGFLDETQTIELTTQEKQKLSKAKASYNSFISNKEKVGDTVYITEPTYKTLPLVKGVYKDEALQMATDYLNIARNCIGIQEVKLDKTIASAAEAKAVLVRYGLANGYSSGHNMAKPAGVDDDLYKEAMTYMSENLFMGNVYSSIGAAIDDSYAAEGPTVLGHRYNVLNYSANLIGMASCNNQGVQKMSSKNSTATTPVNVAWPPEGIMPTDNFSTGYWSIRFYKNYSRTFNETVTIKWLNTGRVYNITGNNDEQTLKVSGNQIVFYDSNIICGDGDVLEITINNLKDSKTGEVTSYTYRTCFVQFGDKKARVQTTDFTLSDSDLSMAVNESKNIKVSFKPENTENKLLRWKSQNEKVVKVKQDGTLEAVAEGTAQIIVICGNISKSINVTVEKGLPFKDVKKGSWYYNAVKYVFENNIIKGYNDITFAPNDKLTRGMMVTILYRMEGEPKTIGKPTFPDVQDSSKYYYKAVKWATDNKIVNGYSNGKFGPNDNLQRQQLAVILNKYAQYKGKDVSKTNDLKEFADTKQISSYAVKQMKWAVGAGVISGNDNKQTGEKTLNPKGEATRAEVSAMMEKYCKNIDR